MEISEIRVFLAAVDEGSFRKAGTKVGYAQPTVTMIIKRLETELGHRLFRRGNSGVKLTHAGLEFQGYALEIVRQAEAAQRNLSRWRDGKAPRLRIGHSPSQRELVVSGIAPMLSAGDGLRVTVQEAISPQIQARVQHGELDIGLVHTQSSPEGVGCLKLMDTVLRLAVHREHRFAKNLAVDLEALATERFVVTRSGGRSRQIVGKYFDQHKFVPNIAVEASTMTTVLMAVRGSRDCVTILPTSSPLAAEAQGVVFVGLVPECRVESCFLIWNKKEFFAPELEPARRFRDTIVALLELPVTTAANRTIKD